MKALIILNGWVEIRVKKIVIAFFMMVMLLPGFLFASFEDLEIGARATSMAGAFTAQCDDISTIFYNPAGLGRGNREG